MVLWKDGHRQRRQLGSMDSGNKLQRQKKGPWRKKAKICILGNKGGSCGFDGMWGTGRDGGREGERGRGRERER